MRFTSLSDSPISVAPPRRCSTAAARTLLYSSHIILTILMTLATQTGRLDAASIASRDTMPHKTRHKQSRITRETSNQLLTDTHLGDRNCSQAEEQEMGCLAGNCLAVVNSQIHTFIVCNCPKERQGPRCEEVAINTDEIALVLKELTNEELCENEQWDVLAKMNNDFFIACMTLNGYMDSSPELDSEEEKELDQSEKQRIRAEKRETKRIERAKKRERKLRRRERKRAKKMKKKIAEKEKTSKSRDSKSDHREIRERDTSRIANNPNLFIEEKDFEAEKDHSGHKHKIRHEDEKSLSRRRRKLSSESSKSRSKNTDDTSSSSQQVFIPETPNKSSRRRTPHKITFLNGMQHSAES